MMFLYYAYTGKRVSRSPFHDAHEACRALCDHYSRTENLPINVVDENGRVHAKLECGVVSTWNTDARRWQVWQPSPVLP